MLIQTNGAYYNSAGLQSNFGAINLVHDLDVGTNMTLDWELNNLDNLYIAIYGVRGCNQTRDYLQIHEIWLEK